VIAYFTSTPSVLSLSATPRKALRLRDRHAVARTMMTREEFFRR
jgi:hypothetical protein